MTEVFYPVLDVFKFTLLYSFKTFFISSSALFTSVALAHTVDLNRQSDTSVGRKCSSEVRPGDDVEVSAKPNQVV